MHNVPDTELFSAYLDGELTADEQLHVEKLLAVSPEARQLLEDFRAVSTTLQNLPLCKLEEDLSPKVMEIAQQRGRAVSMPSETSSAKPAAGRAAETLTSEPLPPLWKEMWKDISWRGILSRRALAWSGIAVAVAVMLRLAAPPEQKMPGRVAMTYENKSEKEISESTAVANAQTTELRAKKLSPELDSLAAGDKVAKRIEDKIDSTKPVVPVALPANRFSPKSIATSEGVSPPTAMPMAAVPPAGAPSAAATLMPAAPSMLAKDAPSDRSRGMHGDSKRDEKAIESVKESAIEEVAKLEVPGVAAKKGVALRKANAAAGPSELAAKKDSAAVSSLAMKSSADRPEADQNPPGEPVGSVAALSRANAAVQNRDLLMNGTGFNDSRAVGKGGGLGAGQQPAIVLSGVNARQTIAPSLVFSCDISESAARQKSFESLLTRTGLIDQQSPEARNRNRAGSYLQQNGFANTTVANGGGIAANSFSAQNSATTQGATMGNYGYNHSARNGPLAQNQTLDNGNQSGTLNYSQNLTPNSQTQITNVSGGTINAKAPANVVDGQTASAKAADNYRNADVAQTPPFGPVSGNVAQAGGLPPMVYDIDATSAQVFEVLQQIAQKPESFSPPVIQSAAATSNVATPEADSRRQLAEPKSSANAPAQQDEKPAEQQQRLPEAQTTPTQRVRFILQVVDRVDANRTLKAPLPPAKP